MDSLPKQPDQLPTRPLCSADPSPLQRNAPQHHHDRALRIANDTESLPHHQRGRDDGRKVERLHEDLPNTNEMSVRSAKGRRRDRTCRTPSRRNVAISSENMEGRVVGREGGLELEDGRDETCSFELGWIQCEVDVDIWRPVETSKGGRRSRVSGGQQRDTSRRRALARLVLQLSRRLPSLYKSLHLAATDLVI